MAGRRPRGLLARLLRRGRKKTEKPYVVAKTLEIRWSDGRIERIKLDIRRHRPTRLRVPKAMMASAGTAYEMLVDANGEGECPNCGVKVKVRKGNQ